MRHVVGFLAGLAFTPVVLLGSGWAFVRLAGVAGGGVTFLSTSGLLTLAGLCGLALLVALMLVPPRLTPLLPGVVGLALVGFTVTVVLRPEVIERLPSLPGLGGAVSLTELGLYLPLGLALVLPMFVASRWSRAGVVDEHPSASDNEYLDGLYDEDDEEFREPVGQSRRGGRRRRSG